MAAKQGFLMYYSKGDAIGTKVSVRYRRSGRLSGVVVKRGSTVYTRMSVRNFVYSKDLEGSCGQYSVANCRCDVSAFDLRKSMWRLSKIDARVCISVVSL